MTMMIVFNKQQHIGMVSSQTIAAVRVQVTTSQAELNNRPLTCLTEIKMMLHH